MLKREAENAAMGLEAQMCLPVVDAERVRAITSITAIPTPSPVPSPDTNRTAAPMQRANS